jgi:hypothetical protein
MAIDETFAPGYTKAQIVAPGTVSASTLIGKGSKSLCLTNLGTVLCYVRVSTGTFAATSADYAVLPGAQVSISKAQDDDTVSYVTGTGATSLHIMPGEGF